MASKYSILVEATIKESSIQSQLNKISKDFVFNIKAKIDISDVENQIRNITTKLGELQKKADVGAQKKARPTIIDVSQDQKSLDALYAKIEQIKVATGASAVKFDIFTDVGKDGEKITKALLTYDDTLGNIHKETYAWKIETEQVGNAVKKTAEWLNVTNKYTDDGVKKERQRAAEIKKTADLIAKMNQQAEMAIAKTTGKKSPEVQRVLSIAEALKQAAASGNVTQMQKFSGELKVASAAMGALGKDTLSWGGAMKIALERIAQWGIATAVIYGGMRKIREMIQNVKELDSSLVELQKVSDITGASLRAFTEDAFIMGETVGRTGKEAIDATTEFVRAGFELREALDMGEAALIMTNVAEGITDTKDATSALIAVLRGYQMETTETIRIVNILNEVSNTQAVNFDNLADGVRRSAGVLAQSGTELEELTGLLTGGFEQLRNMEKVAMGLNFISLRLRGIGEDGESIEGLMPKLQKDFMEIANISLLDPDTGGLRSTYDILSDMAEIFPTLTSMQRGYLMEAAAGIRQVSVLEAILKNWENVEKATESAKNSVGSAHRENEIFLNSIEGKMNKMESAWQKLSQSTFDSDVMKLFVDIGTELIKLIDKFTLFNTIIVVGTIAAFVKMGIILPGITAAIDAVAISMGIASGAATTLSLALTGGLVGIAIIGAITAFKLLSRSAEDTYEAFAKLRSQAESNREELNSLAEEYQTLANKQEKNADDLKRLLDIQSLVNIKYGAAKEGITLYSDAIDNNSKAIQNNIEWIKRRAEFEAREFLVKNKRRIEEAKIGLSQRSNDPLDIYGIQKPMNLYEERDYLSKRLEIEDDLLGLIQKRLDYINNEIFAYEQILLEAEEYKNLLVFIRDVSPDFSDVGVKNMMESLGIVGDLIGQYKGLTDTLKNLGETSDIVYSTIQKNAEGTLTFADIQKLGDAYEDYIDILEIEGDRVTINTDKLQAYNIANIEAALSKAQVALATDVSNEKLQKEVLVLEAYLSQAHKATAQSRDFVNNFNAMIKGVADSMSKDELSGGFDVLSRKLLEVNGQFEDGIITSKEYADAINDSLKSIDFNAVFKDKDSAEIFFTGMVANAAQALSQINSEFSAGSILFSEYTDSLISFSGVMDTISGLTESLVESFGDAGDIAGDIAEKTTSGFSLIAEGMQELTELQETNILMEQAVQQIRSESIRQGTEDYNILMDKIAEAAWATGKNWVDMDGKAFTSAKNLADYLKGSTSNFFNFANQTAGASGAVIKNIMAGAGTVLEALGKAIQDFDAKITFTPRLKGGSVDFPAIVGGKAVSDWFKLPTIEFDITGSGGEAVQGLGRAIESLGASFMPKSSGGGWRDAGAGTRDGDDPFDFDWTIYENELNQVTGLTGKGAEGAKALADALGGVGKVAKEDQKSIAALFGLVIDKIKEEKKEQKELLKVQQEVIKEQQKALKDQLNAYKEIIDVRKELLDTQKEELSYQDEIADKNKSIARIQQELATLALDDSLESQARQLELKNELAEQMEDLARTQRDNQFEQQKTALDAEYEAYRKSIEIQDSLLQQQYDAIDLQIKTIDEFLSKSGLIAQEALRRIAEQAPDLYQSLIDWNSEYGSGIDRDVTEAWNEAYEALKRYADLIDALRGISEYGDTLLSVTLPTHHSGLASGPAGGVKTPTNEVFAKLMAGEVILNENDMLRVIRMIPEISSKLQTASTPMGLTIAGNLVNIEGNADKDTVEEIKKVADQVINMINQSLLKRGYTRGSQLFQF